MFTVKMNPLKAIELLSFAVFGQTSPTSLIVTTKEGQPKPQPPWTEYFFTFFYGIYMLVSVVVLINLLIAMMSDTYQRIQV